MKIIINKNFYFQIYKNNLNIKNKKMDTNFNITKGKNNSLDFLFSNNLSTNNDSSGSILSFEEDIKNYQNFLTDIEHFEKPESFIDSKESDEKNINNENSEVTFYENEKQLNCFDFEFFNENSKIGSVDCEVDGV